MKYTRDHRQRVNRSRAALRAIKAGAQLVANGAGLIQHRAVTRLRSILHHPIGPLFSSEHRNVPATWSEAVASLSRAELANEICARFFAGGSTRLAATPAPPDAEVIPTLGQMLQSLQEQLAASNAAESAGGRTLVDLLPQVRRFDSSKADAAQASPQSVIMAKAA